MGLARPSGPRPDAPEYEEWLSRPEVKNWPQFSNVPSQNAVVIIAWCENEFCQTIYRNEEGEVVPKPEPKKKKGNAGREQIITETTVSHP